VRTSNPTYVILLFEQQKTVWIREGADSRTSLISP
jgi:hypothetical protein